jgi:hypothetical protein
MTHDIDIVTQCMSNDRKFALASFGGDMLTRIARRWSSL